MSNFDEIEMKLYGPEYNGSNITNHVLIQQSHDNITQVKSDDHGKDSTSKKNIAYYIPSYVRIRIKNFTNMEHANLQATINVVLYVSINMKLVPQIIQDQIMKRLILRFNRNEAINLGGEDLLEVNKILIEQGVWQFTIRKHLVAGIVGEIYLTPFEMLYLILTVSIHNLQITQQMIDTIISEKHQQIQKIAKVYKNNDDDDKDYIQARKKEIDDNIEKIKEFKNIKIYFNLMDAPDQPGSKFCKMSYSDEGTFGNYDLAEKKLDVQYTNSDVAKRVLDKSGDKDIKVQKDHAKIQEFCHAHFQIPLYKFPLVGIVTIFVPLWLLGVINLGIFFQDSGLADRIGSLAGLMIAFVALIPVIREQLPPNPDITLVQALVYLQTFTTIFCFIESLRVRDDADFVFVWSTSGLFIASVIIQLLQLTIIIILAIQYWFKKKFQYNKHHNQEEKMQFYFKDWFNADCDKHFRRKIDSREIQVLQIKQEQQTKKDVKGQNPQKKGSNPYQ